MLHLLRTDFIKQIPSYNQTLKYFWMELFDLNYNPVFGDICKNRDAN